MAFERRKHGGAQYFWFFLLALVISTGSKSGKNIFSILIFFAVVTLIGIEFFYADIILDYNTRTDRYIDVLISIILSLATIFIILSIYKYLFSDAIITVELKNNQLIESNIEIEAQKEELFVQRNDLAIQRDKTDLANEKITNSITYASHIQAAILTSENELSDLVNNYFILAKPRDIVSGDFYWVKQLNGKIILAVADCTGHGVPGAFMSILGVSILNETTNTNKEQTAGSILDSLRKKLVESLATSGSTTIKDGIDIALIVFDEENKSIQYAGANNPLYIIRNGELLETKADTMYIGVERKGERPFKNNNIELQTKDMIYLFSDGYQDQFGGKKGRKYMKGNFKKLLIKTANEPVNMQKKIINDEYIAWCGDFQQIDDILIVGIRV